MHILKKRSDMDRAVLPEDNTMPAFPLQAFTRWRHPRHRIAAYYSYNDPEGIKG